MSDNGPLESKRKQVQRHWYNELPQHQKDKIIGPAFEAAHSDNDAKREATRRYEQGGDATHDE